MTKRKPIAAAAKHSIIAMHAEVKIQAAAEGEDAKKPRRFEVLAYTGGAMEIKGYSLPIVIDLSGMGFSNSLIANLDHTASKRVGHVTERTKADGQLKLGGVASAATPARDEVIDSADNGFIWQASVEADVIKIVEVEAGKTVQVNGQSFDGPLYVARKSTLMGFAFVSHGADDNTIVSIAAGAANSKETDMDMEFNKWIEAMSFDAETLTEDQKTGLRANYEGRNALPVKPKSNDLDSLETILAKEKGNRERVKQITKVTAAAMQENPNSIESIEAMAKLAIEGEWEQDKFELELLRATRPQAHTVFSRHVADGVDGKVIEAAICMSGNFETSKLEKHYDDRTLQTAHDRFRNGIGLNQLFLLCAKANGYNDPYATEINRDVLRAAFAPQDRRMIHAGGFSTLSLPGILSNTANKFLVEGFNAVDAAWRQIAAIRSVTNFYAITSYSLTGGMTYEKVGAGGDIKHGTLGETSYTNQAETYGRMFAITRKDIINDDLGALTAVPRKLGRGAALKLNQVFWTEFLDNSAFFVAGNNNVITGAGSALGTAAGAGLAAAELKFSQQTDPDGEPIGTMPAILLVPPTLHQTAISYMNAGFYLGGSSAIPGANNWQGRFKPVTSPYMENSAYTGYSAAAWYLLANPADIAAIEVCFLNGREAPFVETADADFNTLGVQMRGYSDFGVNLQEPRAGVRAAGS